MKDILDTQNINKIISLKKFGAFIEKCHKKYFVKTEQIVNQRKSGTSLS